MCKLGSVDARMTAMCLLFLPLCTISGVPGNMIFGHMAACLFSTFPNLPFWVLGDHPSEICDSRELIFCSQAVTVEVRIAFSVLNGITLLVKPIPHQLCLSQKGWMHQRPVLQ